MKVFPPSKKTKKTKKETAEIFVFKSESKSLEFCVQVNQQL